MSVAIDSKTMGKEIQLWKERYFVERKCRRLIENWAHYTFGFDVKTEYEKATNEIKIQGFENKEAVKTAAIPNESTESGIRAVIMEGKMAPEDFLEDAEDLLTRTEFTSSIVESEVTPAPQTVEVSVPPAQTGTSSTSASSSGISGSSRTTAIVPLGQQQFQPFEITSTGGENNSQEIYYIGGNYDETNVGGQPQYFILKSNDNEDLPIHIDYSNIFGGAGNSSNSEVNDKQVYYRILGTTDVPTNNNSDGSSQEMAASFNTSVPNSVQQKSPVKRKAPVSKSQNSKAKKNTPTKTKSGSDDTKNPAEAENTPNSRITLPSDSKLKNNMSVLKTSEEKNPNAIEFGLTLREKAEIYVRTKASEALKKSGSGYECSLCPDVKYVYNSYENALTHTKSHFDRTPYKCEYCTETFAVQREVLQHRKLAHPKPKTQTTSIVSSSTNTVTPGAPLIQDKSLVVSNSNSKQVVTKPSGYKTNSQFTIANPKPKNFACQVEGCEWAYSTAEELGWHMKAHQQNRI